MSWPNIDSKTQMRLNILRHRQKLLKLLEDVDDTTLKPRIKFDPTDFDKLLGKPIKKELVSNDVEVKDEIKEELVEDPIKEPIEEPIKKPVEEPIDLYDSSDEDFISVGSNEIWDNTGSAVKNIDIKRSSRSSIPYNYERPNVMLTEDHMYALDHMEDKGYHEENSSFSRRKYRSPNPIGQRTRSKPREIFDRVKHNAKERACREEIGKMFATLRDLCSNLDCNRRIPSKQSILIAAKKECDEMTLNEKKLIVKKNKLRALNKFLIKKLDKVARANT